MDKEVILALGYAAFLVGVAHALGAWAQRTDDAAKGHGIPVWPHQEEAHLRRGLALALSLLATVLLSAEVVRQPHAKGVAVLAMCLLVSGYFGWRDFASFRRNPYQTISRSEEPGSPLPGRSAAQRSRRRALRRLRRAGSAFRSVHSMRGRRLRGLDLRASQPQP